MSKTLTLTLLLICTLLCTPAAAQLDPSVGANIRRQHVHLGPTQATPIPAYSIDLDVWPPVDTTALGYMPVSRPSRFVGTVTVDHGYYVQNRYPEWVGEYKVYTANFVRFGINAQQLCTQFCGQVNWGNGLVYALAPFAGTYHGAPTPTPTNCEGIAPASDWHFQRARVTFPVTIDLEPGQNPVTVWPVGGMSTWDNAVQSSPSHRYALDISVHTIEIEGDILSR